MLITIVEEQIRNKAKKSNFECDNNYHVVVGAKIVNETIYIFYV